MGELMSVSSVLRAGPGHSTVQLLREDNTPFPIVNCKGVPCAVAIPGAVFKVAVEVLPTCTSHIKGETIRACIRVDGRRTGLANRFKKPGVEIWDGFYDDTTVRPFTFAAPERSGGTEEQHDRNVQEGKVTVHLDWVRKGGPKPDARGLHRHHGLKWPQTARAAALPEGKKFFLAPSLMTTAGKERHVDLEWSTRKHIHVQEMETLTLSYETASTLLLRRVLRHDNPAHQALLDAEAAARRAMRSGQGAADGGGTAEGTVGSSRGAVRPRVKRERGGEAVVDLTAGMVARPSVNPDVMELCDLTADEDVPAWSATKRVARPAAVMDML